MRRKLLPARLAAISIAALWVGCLFFPAMQAGRDTISSLFFLLWGWAGLMILDVDWLANPLLLAAVFLLFARTSHPRTMGAVGFALFLLVMKSAARGTMIVDENQNSVPIDHHLLGWYMWIAAQVVAIAALCAVVVEPRAMGLPPRAGVRP